MMEWYRICAIDERTFALCEPLHPEDPHSYLVLGEERAALIDTGLGVFSMKEEIRKLTELPVTVLTTHAHWDHVGSHREFEHIAVHPLELGLISGENPMTEEQLMARLFEDGWQAPAGFDASCYRFYDGGADMSIEEGGVIDLGGRILKVLHTPGHSPGSCSFYEEERRYLFCGDLLYDGALYAHLAGSDPLVYRDSMDRIARMDIERLPPGHNSLDQTGALARQAAAAFDELYEKGLLKKGSGTFSFGGFSIKLSR